MPRIKLLTISSATLTNQGRDRLDLAQYGRQFSGRPALSASDLLEAVPEMQRFAQVEPDLEWGAGELGNEPPDLWQQLAAHVQRLFDREADLDGLVIVHGTNMLEETAYFLHLVLKTEKPVVLVGAQRPFSALSSDGPLNLVNGIRVAAAPGARGRGVLVVLNDQIHSARFVTKSSTYRLETFESADLGPVGFADADRIVFYYGLERRHTLQTPWRPEGLGELPRVEILYDFLGASGELAQAAIKAGAKGVVVAGAGAGSAGAYKEPLQAAAQQGVAVVRSARVGSGRVLAEDNYAFPGSVAADNLNPQKARVLLQLALTLTNDPAELQRFFDTY